MALGTSTPSASPERNASRSWSSKSQNEQLQRETVTPQPKRTKSEERETQMEVDEGKNDKEVADKEDSAPRSFADLAAQDEEAQLRGTSKNEKENEKVIGDILDMVEALGKRIANAEDDANSQRHTVGYLFLSDIIKTYFPSTKRCCELVASVSLPSWPLSFGLFSFRICFLIDYI